MTLTAGLDFWTQYRKDVHKWILVHIRRMGLPQRPANHTGGAAVAVRAAGPGPGQIRQALLRDPAFHDDVESEVFLAFHTALQAEKVPAEEDKARAWMYGTTRYVTWRQATRQALVTGDQTPDGEAEVTYPMAASPETTAAARETLERVWLRLPQLPANHQEALRAASEGESPEETAQRLGKKAATVRSWLFRARNALSEPQPVPHAA
jgi:RNA polymerase sigma factor (sigma-70 family)